ncbi:MAG: hypothetical protein U0228_04565 [Myxococcaceae bacterium]
MSRLMLAALLTLCACGPDVTAWKGSYAVSGSMNDGRQPEPVTGTLTVADGALFTLTSDPKNGNTWTISMNASMVDGARAAFTTPSQATLNVSPANGCTYPLTINMAELHLLGGAVDGTISGRANITCSTGTTATDFLLSFGGNKK